MSNLSAEVKSVVLCVTWSASLRECWLQVPLSRSPHVLRHTKKLQCLHAGSSSSSSSATEEEPADCSAEGEELQPDSTGVCVVCVCAVRRNILFPPLNFYFHPQPPEGAKRCWKYLFCMKFFFLYFVFRWEATRRLELEPSNGLSVTLLANTNWSQLDLIFIHSLEVAAPWSHLLSADSICFFCWSH